jgi:HEAT repeat protein
LRYDLLSSPDVAERDEAWERLREQGERGRAILEKAAADPDPETSARASRLLLRLSLASRYSRALLEAFPLRWEDLRARDDRAAREIFLQITDVTGGFRRFPRIGRPDWDALAPSALHGSVDGLERSLVLRRIEELRITGAALEIELLLKHPLWSSSRREMIRALGRLGAAKAVAPYLTDPDLEVREISALSLSDLGDASAIPALRALALEPSEERRIEAIRGLVRLGVRDCGPDLAMLLQDRDWGIREAAAEALGLLGLTSQSPRVERLLTDPGAEYRVSAIRALVRLDARASVPLLLPLLRDRNHLVVTEAIRAAALLGATEARESVLAALASEDTVVRSMAFAWFSELGKPQDAAVILPFLTREPRQGIKALGVLGDPVAVPAIAAFLGADTPLPVRLDAVSALGRLRSPAAVEALKKALDDPALGTSALLALAELGERSVAGRVLPLLESPDRNLTITKLHPLLALNPPEDARDRLSRLAADERHEVRARAAGLLGSLGDAEWAAPHLDRCLADPAPAVRRSALLSYRRLQRAPSGNLLDGALRDPDPDVRIAAARLAGEALIRSAARELEKLLLDPHHRVREAAAGALCRLGLDAGVPELLDLAVIGTCDLSPLNALRSPELWEKLRTLRWTSRDWWSEAEAARELGRRLGVELRRGIPDPGSLPGRWPIHELALLEPPSLLNILQSLSINREFIVDKEAIRIVDRESAAREWARWWAAR